ncbi:MAG: ATP-binding protein [Clostridiales Family XIII bacterium]|jgi:predicted AAA+ superfamily ATPase|nr:ATP-binding protein [Clostridiales Family XIII bacterium]
MLQAEGRIGSGALPYSRMIERSIRKIVAEYQRSFPVLAFTGARQTGKTTLIKELFPDYTYLNLEDLSTYARVKDDIASYINIDTPHVIIDEVQRVPELLSQIQAVSDEQKIAGSYIISGSQNLLLSEHISQSLTGRAAYIELPGLTLAELRGVPGEGDLYERIISGFYPAVYDRQINPTLYYDQYMSTYVERDVRLIKSITNLDAFRGFVGLLAGSVGRPFNASSMAGNLGVSPNTVKDWLSVLEATYIVFKLKPYYKNIGKQITKTPKIYFYDTGLLSFLLGVTAPDDLKNHYMIGSIFENLVIADIKKTIMNKRGIEKLFFYRDKRYEVDLIINKGTGLRPVEIKRAMTYSSHFTEGLRYWTDLFADDTTKILPPHIVYTGPTQTPGKVFGLTNWQDAAALL